MTGAEQAAKTCGTTGGKALSMGRTGRPFRSKLMMWIAVLLFTAACLLFAISDPANADPKLFLAGAFCVLFIPADRCVSILLFTQKRE